MSNFFGDVDDSSEDESYRSEVAQSEVDEDSEEEINNKWMRNDDDEDSESGDEKAGVQSKNAKALNEIQSLADELEFSIDSSFKESHRIFGDLRSKADDYYSKKGTRPPAFLTALQMLNDLFKTHEESPPEFENKEEKSLYKKLSAEVKSCTESYAADIDRQKKLEDGTLEETDAVDDGKVEDWSPEGMVEKLNALTQEKSNTKKIQTCRKIATHATQQGMPQFVIAALGQQMLAVLAEDRNETHVTAKHWKDAFDLLSRCYELAMQNPKIAVYENVKFDRISDRGTVLMGFAPMTTDLYDKYINALQFTDKSKEDAILALIQEEEPFRRFATRVLDYYAKRGTKKAVARLSFVLLDILHARHEFNHAKLVSPKEDLRTMVRDYHGLVVANGTIEEGQRATLLLAYHLALHDDYHGARDVLLQAKLSDPSTLSADMRVPSNRVVVQLGLAAFRIGNYSECNAILSDLCSRNPRDIKVLIGQEIIHQRHDEHSALKELQSRKRLVPFHRQISLELIDAASLTAAMLLTVVAEAKKPYERGTRPKHFAKLMSQQNYALLTGPAATFRESVYSAFNAIIRSDVSGTMSLCDFSVWKSFNESSKAMDQLRQQIKLDSLRVFLIIQGANYVSISVEHLADKFCLSPQQVRATVSQLLLDRDNVIVGFWDHAEECLTIERGNPSRLLHLAEQSADRLSFLGSGQTSARHFDRRGGRGRGARAR